MLLKISREESPSGQFFFQKFWTGRGERKAGRKFLAGRKFSLERGENKGLKFVKLHKMAIRNEERRIDRILQNWVFLKANHTYFF